MQTILWIILEFLQKFQIREIQFPSSISSKSNLNSYAYDFFLFSATTRSHWILFSRFQINFAIPVREDFCIFRVNRRNLGASFKHLSVASRPSCRTDGCVDVRQKVSLIICRSYQQKFKKVVFLEWKVVPYYLTTWYSISIKNDQSPKTKVVLFSRLISTIH